MNIWTRRLLRLLGAAFSVVLGLGAIGAFLILYPDSPLPDRWNPLRPLEVSDPVTPLTRWKLQRALLDDAQCRAALTSAAEFDALPDFEESEDCHIRNQVALRGIGGARLSEVNTRCQVALRIAMWMEHGVQPAAERHFGQAVRQAHHFSSYNCRPIRNSTRISTHASANSIDISGFTLEDGRKLMLLDGWGEGDATVSAFFRDTRDTACDWFRVTLGPDYNDLHANHFHLQHTGWGLCR